MEVTPTNRTGLLYIEHPVNGGEGLVQFSGLGCLGSAQHSACVNRLLDHMQADQGTAIALARTFLSDIVSKFNPVYTDTEYAIHKTFVYVVGIDRA